MTCQVLDIRIPVLIALLGIMINSGALMVTGRSLYMSVSARANSDPVDLGVRWQPPDESQLLPTRSSRAVNADAGTQSFPEQLEQRRIKVPESDDLSESQVQPLQAAVELPGHGTSAAIAPSPRTTVMKCLGTTTVTRACHFEDVYYELDSKRFVYFGPPGAAPELFGQSHRAGEPWLRLIRCGIPVQHQHRTQTLQKNERDVDKRNNRILSNLFNFFCLILIHINLNRINIAHSCACACACAELASAIIISHACSHPCLHPLQIRASKL